MYKSLILNALSRNLLLLTIFLLAACGKETSSLKTGPWRGVITMQGQEMPFNFTVDSVKGGVSVTLRNAEERLLLDEVRMEGDTAIMVMHIFDAELRAKVAGDSLKGYFVKNYEKNYRLPFRAAAGQTFRFKDADVNPSVDFSGTWATTFTNETDTTIAVGIFKQNGNIVTGTFLTPTGDYRYLEGNVVGNTLKLSVLDGNHAFLFTAEKISDNELTGTYRSGKAWMQTWKAVRNDNATLPDAGTLTALKDGIDTFPFSFPNEDSILVTADDAQFKGKPVIIQILGTWCPNCMDETKFLSAWYRENKNKGIAVVGLAFESGDEFGYAAGRVRKMRQKTGVEYPVLIAGNKDKKKAAEALPMLREVVAFPTTIYVGKDGKVKKIHTGFNGPGTGVHYERFIEDFNATVDGMLRD